MYLTISPLAVTSIKTNGARPSTSGFVGVAFDKTRSADKAWKAYVTLAATRKRKNIGRYPTAEAAADARAAFIAEHGIADPKAKATTVTTGEVSA